MMQFSHLLPVSFARYRPGDTCLDVLLSSYLDYTTRYILQLYSIFRTNSCPHVLIMPGKGNVHASVQSQDKQKSKVMSPLEKVEAFDQRNREWEVVLLDGVSELAIHSMKKNENKSGHVNASAPSSAKMSCIRHCYPFLQKWKWPCVHGWKMVMEAAMAPYKWRTSRRWQSNRRSPVSSLSLRSPLHHALHVIHTPWNQEHWHCSNNVITFIIQ